MSAPTPYLCSRCLRAARRLPISIPVPVATAAVRSYHSGTNLPRRAAAPESATLTARTLPRTPQLPMRLLSTSRTLLKPALESQSASPQTQPPPPANTSSSPSAAAQQYTTTTVLNPRFDEETGAPMAIAITPRANRRLQQIMTKDQNPGLCLRVTVESGGCHGFQYLMSLVDMSKVDESEDVLFVASSPEAPVSEGAAWREIAEGKPKVVIDESSLELLQGSNVDYTMELIGSQFKIDNPRASSSCGCGTSFDVKI